MLEPISLIAGPGNELVLGGALRDGDAVRVEVVLEFGLGPSVEGVVFRGVGLEC